MPYFICPNCRRRSVDDDGIQGLTGRPVACTSCGFGFLFQILDDYYPAPGTGFVVCNNEGRIIATGQGVFELTGYTERELMGHEVQEALHLDGDQSGSATSPIATALEWGVRQLDQSLALRTASGAQKQVKVDLFPAYDEDGGLMVALTPR